MSAPEQVITENLDIWTNVIKPKSATGRGRGRGKGKNSKHELYGIKKMRELILELAVRGLLVPQDADDEPASELLKKIAGEKEKLIKENKIKKQKVLPSISNEEKPFELPEGWEFKRLGDLSYVFSGNSFKSHDFNDSGGTKVIKITNAGVGELIETDDYLPEHFLAEYKSFRVHEGDLVLALTRPYISTGLKISICPNSYRNSLLNQRVAAIRVFIENKFLYQFMQSVYVLGLYKARFGSSGLQPNLKIGDVTDLVIPVPPLVEQQRIVAKVDELMALCDQLEQQTETSLTAHQILVETMLGTLVNATDDVQDAQVSREAGRPRTTNSAFEEAWQRIVEHFDTLFTTEHSIDQLKQIILQLAVMGKLVPQDPNDDPANKLLKKIAIEKENLIKEKKIKKQRVHLPISDEEKLFNLPVGWEWERLQNLSVVGTGSTPSRDNFNFYTPPEFNWVTSGETSEDFIYKTKEKVAEKAIQETNVSIYPVGTLIVAMYGQGKTRGQVTELMIEAGTNQACAAIQLIESSKEHRGYIKLFFKKAYEELRSHAAGGAQPNLNVGKVSSTVIPMPPLKEQHRIVAKVDELIALCDQLNVRLVEAQTTQLYLADAMAEQAVT